MRLFNKILEILLAAILFFITILIFIAVIFRYVFNSPLIFSFELSLVLFAWIIFLGAILVENNDDHIGFNIVDAHLSKNIKLSLVIIRHLIIILVLFIIVYYGFILAQRSKIKLTAMDISIKWLYFSYPIGFLLIAVQKMIKVYGLLFSKSKKVDK